MTKRRRGAAASPPLVPSTPAARRRAAAAAPRRRRIPIRAILLVAAVVAGSAAGAVAIFSAATAAPYSCASTLAPTQASQGDGAEVRNQESRHVAPGTRIRYAACPPTSGAHFAAQGAGPIRPGFYAPGSAVVPNGWVHNLEHGFIVVLFRTRDGAPDAATLTALRAFDAQLPPSEAARACGYRSKIVVAPFEDMATPYAVLAWDRVLQMDTWQPDRARAFAERWSGVTAPEPAAC